MLGEAVRPQRPAQLVEDERQNGHGIQHQKHQLVQQRMREKTQPQALDALGRRTIAPGARVPATCLDLVLLLEQAEGVLEVDLLRRGHNGKQILDKEAQKRMPVAYALVVKTNLDQEHGQDPVLAHVKGHGGIDNDLAPERALLGVDDDGEDGGNLYGEDEPALGFLELDEGGGDGDARARQGGRVAPDDGFDAREAAGEAEGRCALHLLCLFVLLLRVAHPEGEGFEEEVDGAGEGYLEDVGDEDLAQAWDLAGHGLILAVVRASM